MVPPKNDNLSISYWPVVIDFDAASCLSLGQQIISLSQHGVLLIGNPTWNLTRWVFYPITVHHQTPAFCWPEHRICAGYSQIILFGRSLGSGPAVFLAAQYPVGGLILVSAFTSIRAAVQSIVGRVVAWTFNERFPNSRTDQGYRVSFVPVFLNLNLRLTTKNFKLKPWDCETIWQVQKCLKMFKAF